MPLHLAVKKKVPKVRSYLTVYSREKKHYLPVSARSAHCSQTEGRCPFSRPRVSSGSSASSQTSLYSIAYAWGQRLSENGGYFTQEDVRDVLEIYRIAYHIAKNCLDCGKLYSMCHPFTQPSWFIVSESAVARLLLEWR